MPENNAKRLESNKRETQQVVKDYVTDSDLPQLESVQENATVKLQAALKAITEIDDASVRDSYSSIIASIKEASDNVCGISWYIGKEHADGTQDLIRDGREAIENKDVSSISFLMQNVNIARAAELLLDQAIDWGASEDDVRALRKKIRADARLAIQNYKKADAESTKKFNSGIIQDLENLGVFANVTKNLNIAKEIVSFDDCHYHITSLSQVVDHSGKSRLVAESNIMNLGFTESQKLQFKQIEEAKDYGDIKGLDWYNQLSREARRLVKDNIKKVMSGNYVIPTQLKDVLIGARNSYTKVVSVDNEVVLEMMHSGSPSFHGKGDNLAVTMENMKQIKGFSTKEVSFGSLNSSNSRWVGDKIDSSIVSQLENSTKELAAKYTLSPLNPLRFLGARTVQDNYKKILVGLAQKIRSSGDSLAPIADFLESGEKSFLYFFKTTERSKAALKALAGLSDSEAKGLRQAIEAKSLMEHRRWASLGSNTNLSIVSKMQNVIHYIGNEMENFFCKSGKDRTGVGVFKATEDAVLDHLKLTDKKGRTAALDSLLRTQHMAFLSVGQGGTTGARGIRPSANHWMPYGYKKLTLRTADFTAVKRQRSLFKPKTTKRPTTRSA